MSENKRAGEESGPSQSPTMILQVGPVDAREAGSVSDDAAPSSSCERGAAHASPRALRIEREGAEPLTLSLFPDRTYVFGRAPESSFVFPSDAVSRLHAQLRFDGERWVFRDLNSRNGSYVLRSRDPLEPHEPDLRARAVRLPAGSEHALSAGETLLLANGTSRLVFLARRPETAAGSSRVGADRPSHAAHSLERALNICARHRMPVFLLGPSGSGKTFAARSIHERSRLPGHFVMINCGRLPHDPAQLASELLGHVRGAFTGALGARTGKLRSAHEGTLFLDEVESLPRVAQDFLIDVLESSGNFQPYGASGETHEPPPRFRLISASKLPLARSGLRADLCQRLAAGEVLTLPTLDERREEIPSLVRHFLDQLRSEQRIDAALTEEATAFLQAASWPGQIRELESTVKVVVSREHATQELEGTKPRRLFVGIDRVRSYLEQRQAGFGAAPGATEAPRHASPGDQPSAQDPAPAGRKRPADLSPEEIEAALVAHQGNKTRAAAALGIALNTLKARLHRK